MKRKLKVLYFRDRCIGNASCAALASNQFEFTGQKATLLNGKKEGNEKFTLNVNCDDNEANDILQAARACPVNAIGVVDMEKNEDIVSYEVKENNAREIAAKYDDSKEFILDDKGYFLIRLDRKSRNIEVAFCNMKNNIILKVTGKKPIDIYHTILHKEKLGIRPEHAAYLGRELQKAYTALENNLEYVQDDELDLNKKFSQ